MKKQIGKMMLLACLCLFAAVGLFKADINAADVSASVVKVAYIDSSNHLKLRFAPFTTGTVTCKVTGNGSELPEQTLSAGSDTVDIDISTIYGKGQVYTLTMTANDNKNTLTVNYYTGAGVKSVKAAQSKTSLKVSWDTSGANDYSNIYVDVAKASGTLNNVVEQKCGGTAKSATITSGVESGKDVAYVMGVKDGAYGYGEEKTFEFAAKPSKVTGLTLTGGSSEISLDWAVTKNATGYDIYMQKPGASKFSVVKKNVKRTSYTVKGLKKKKVYKFKVKAVAKANGTTLEGPFSATKSCKVVAATDRVSRFAFITDRSGTVLGLKWAKVKGATDYEVELRESGQGAFVSQGLTKLDYFSFRHLDANKTYDVRVYAVSGSRKSKPSKTFTVNPAQYLAEHRDEMLARKVRTIRYLKNKKCDYTTANYSDETKVAYVNYMGLSSKTKYLIWASLYTQQTTIYEGSKGNWKMIRTFDVASGSWNDRTPRGTHKLFKHETKWQHNGWRTMYVTHFYKKASFHMRPKYNNGKVKDPRIGKPISAACIRCYDADAKFIYNLPLGTTAKIY